MPTHKKKLTDKQRIFCHEYIIDKNATQAAIRAGYSIKNADKIGPELMGKTRISNQIDKILIEQQKRMGITADKVIAEIAKLAFCNVKKNRVYLRDKKGALEMLAKHFNLFAAHQKEGAGDIANYVQIYRPERESKKDVEASCRSYKDD